MKLAIIPFIFAVAGALVYALTTDKIAELGRAALWTGLLVTLFVAANKTVAF